MPIELESGNLQLTDDEIVLYSPAAALIGRVLKEDICLHTPMTRAQFTILYFAHGVVTGDEKLMLDIVAVIESEIDQRNRPH